MAEERQVCNRKMVFWQDFLDSLDTDGGHILIFIIAIIIGFAGVYFKIAEANTVLVGAGSGLLAMLRSAGSNRRRRETTYSVETTATATATEQIESKGDSVNEKPQS